jgi:hypothetical protein
MIVRIFFSTIAFAFTLVIFVLANESASLSKAASGSYNNLNSIIAKTSRFVPSRWSLNYIPKGDKIKIINIIQIMAQMETTVWCADLFPLNNKELYLFIASVATNFFLFVHLFKLK